MNTENKITTGTITRTVLLVLALINQILTSTGHSIIPIDDDTITQVISLAATVITSVAAWWKNNSFTKAAIAGDEAMGAYKLEAAIKETGLEFEEEKKPE